MLSRIVKVARIFLTLRLIEYAFAIFVLSVVPLFWGEEISGENQTLIEGVLDTVAFWAFVSSTYVIFFGYALFSLIVFSIAELAGKLNKSTSIYLNSIPYAVHSLPIMTGFMGGEPASTGLWLVWGLIIIFDAYVPRLFPVNFFEARAK